MAVGATEKQAVRMVEQATAAQQTAEQVATQATETQDVYVGNLRSLWQHWPALAQQVELVDELDMVTCEPTRSGVLTCKALGEQAEAVYLHSRYDPQKEATRWAAGALAHGAKLEDRDAGRVPMCYIIDGFGLGYHVRALYEKLAGDAFVVVSEPNVALLRTALELADFSEMFSSGRLVVVTRPERQEIFDKLKAHGHRMMMGTVFTQPLQRLNTPFHQTVRQLVTEYAAFLRATLLTALGNSIRTCGNLLANLPTYVSTPSIGVLRSRFAGCPAVVVSAGPSLRRNIEVLKKIREQVVLIAVQTTLKPLLAEGIRPDYVTSLDYHQVSQGFFAGLEAADLEGVELVAEPKAHPSVIDYYRTRGTVMLLGNEFARLVLRGGTEFEHDDLPAGSTVAHVAFYLAQYLGADPIIFVGQDLAFTDNVYYSPGTRLHQVWRGEFNRFGTVEMKEWERIVRSRGTLRQVEDQHGQQIYTDEQMFTYLQQFEKDFAACGATVIDATEGGAKKQACQTMTLAQAAQQYCRGPIEQQRFAYRRGLARPGDDKQEAARTLVAKRMDEVDELLQIGQETLTIVREMLDLVEDQQALNRKMVRLDELRTMVRRRQEIYEMVSFVSQAAEMFRYRQDRTIEVDQLEGKERQQRQLMRDAAYVSEINKGCERLKAMLEKCLDRFEQSEDNG